MYHGLLKWFSKVNYLLESLVSSWHTCLVMPMAKLITFDKIKVQLQIK
jgi:hypothetical protein